MSELTLIEDHFIIYPWSFLVLYSPKGEAIQIVVYHTKTEDGEVINL
tara:strand:- start:2568 stop:2708 length:141 start_codon:yes stop_codon:yes gene_type:complete